MVARRVDKWILPVASMLGACHVQLDFPRGKVMHPFQLNVFLHVVGVAGLGAVRAQCLPEVCTVSMAALDQRLPTRLVSRCTRAWVDHLPEDWNSGFMSYYSTAHEVL